MSERAYSTVESIGKLLKPERHILLFGERGYGKSILAENLVRHYQNAGTPCCCISADPGSPTFGIPGALNLADWSRGGWQLRRSEALCSLDASRFRLPLIALLRRLVTDVPSGALVLDSPGVVRGVAGAELLVELISTAKIDLVLVLVQEGQTPPFADELQSTNAEVCRFIAHPDARHRSKLLRAQRRSHLWQHYMRGAENTVLSIENLRLLGTPPAPDCKWGLAGETDCVTAR